MKLLSLIIFISCSSISFQQRETEEQEVNRLHKKSVKLDKISSIQKTYRKRKTLEKIVEGLKTMEGAQVELSGDYEIKNNKIYVNFQK